MTRRLLDHWPQKLGALVLAVLIWILVSTSETTTTQRSLLVPLSVEGVGERRVAVGLPDFVEVTISGPSNRVDRLRPENIEAVLDLTGLQGEFQQTIDVRPPQGIDLIRVNPEQVIGFLEQVSTKQVPVEVVWLQEPPPDVLLEASAEPSTISVSARDEILQRVVVALAPAVPQEGEATVSVFAASAAGLPVREVTLTPPEVSVTASSRPIMVRAQIPLELAPLSVERVRTAQLTQESVEVVGPPSQVEALDTVVAHVDPATVPAAPGRYTLAVRLELPADVVAVETPAASVNVADVGLPQ